MVTFSFKQHTFLMTNGFQNLHSHVHMADLSPDVEDQPDYPIDQSGFRSIDSLGIAQSHKEHDFRKTSLKHLRTCGIGRL